MVIEGPRACGKTRTGMQFSNSMVLFDDPTTATIADIDIQQLINGPAPRLLDEWQLYPQLWNIVRREVDFTQGPGRFILTGSAVPDDDIRRPHSQCPPGGTNPQPGNQPASSTRIPGTDHHANRQC